ncbi:mitochondrial carrier domain-containing protein [Lactarius quietus]|nr:mitochondrial carrier domain-containing protein [Lactarius quietus]
MSPTLAANGKDSGTARVLGSGTSGVAELLIFHPVDTIAKRLMSNKAKVSVSGLSPIIFREYATAPLGRKLLSLFPGLGYAAGYKISQRIYKFGGQPWFNDILTRHYKSNFTNAFGERRPSAARRTQDQAPGQPGGFSRPRVVRIFLEEGTTLYRGWGWTVARNAPGSFALFGASAVTKDYVLGVSDYRKATWTQNFIASVAGANANFESKTRGVTIVRELLRDEGATALFKGLTPKILVVGPKLVFSYTIAQSLIPWFSKYV